jgi:hypothetical protein
MYGIQSWFSKHGMWVLAAIVLPAIIIQVGGGG